MKKVRKILLIFLGICLACTTVSCAKRTEVKKGDSYIYCLNSDRTGLQKVSYESKEKDPLKAAKAMIKELKKPSEEIEYTPPIPKDVKVKPEDLRVSKVHCAIIRSGDKLYLRDEGSKNHTYLNGKQIHKPIVIQKEDVITVGETRLEVVKILRETR